jgi:hypothetical protein
MAKGHEIKVDPYRRKVPSDYRDHGDKVLAYVPPDSKWAKDPKTRVKR